MTPFNNALLVLAASALVSAAPQKVSPDGLFELTWFPRGDSIDLILNCKTCLGWVAIGFGQDWHNNMDSYMCFVDNGGDRQLIDGYYAGQDRIGAPVPDKTMHAEIMNAVSSAATGTMCVIRRKLVTGDSQDVDITAVPMNVYYAANTVAKNALAYHQIKGTFVGCKMLEIQDGEQPLIHLLSAHLCVFVVTFC